MDLEQIQTLELEPGAHDLEGPEDQTRRKTLIGFAAPQQTLKAVEVQVNEGTMRMRERGACSPGLKACERTTIALHTQIAKKNKKGNK